MTRSAPSGKLRQSCRNRLITIFLSSPRFIRPLKLRGPHTPKLFSKAAANNISCDQTPFTHWLGGKSCNQRLPFISHSCPRQLFLRRIIPSIWRRKDKKCLVLQHRIDYSRDSQRSILWQRIEMLQEQGGGKHIGLSKQFDSSMYCVGPLALSVMAHSRINKVLWSHWGWFSFWCPI